MAEGAIGSVIDTLEFETDVGQYPDIIHIQGDVYAVAYGGPSGDGWLCTFTIDSSGNVGNSVIDTLEFDATNCISPKIIHVSGDFYAIAYEIASGIKVITVDIDSAGAIESAVEDTLTLTDTGSTVAMGSIIHISGDYFAVTYNDNDYDGKVVTFTITSAGAIGASEIDTFEFDTLQGINPSIINISGTMYAIAYTGDANDGWVCTFNISTVGVIDNSTTATLEFDADIAASCKIIKVSGDYYAIAYKGTDGDGFVKTLPIYSDGAIGAVVSTLEVDIADGQYPSIIKVGGTLFAVAYERDEGGGTLKGVLRSFTVSSAGVISSVIATLEFDTSRTTFPNLLLTAGSSGIVAVVYEGVDGDGFVKTASITAVSTGGELAGQYAVVEERFHYVDAYGKERYILGELV